MNNVEKSLGGLYGLQVNDNHTDCDGIPSLFDVVSYKLLKAQEVLAKEAKAQPEPKCMSSKGTVIFAGHCTI